jgi:NitT/TauT family transport system permease protein
MAWTNPRRLLKSYHVPKSLPVDLGLAAGLIFLAAFLLLGTSSLRPYDQAALDTRPSLLPLYLLLSLARLAVAYAVALVMALAVGNLAARSAFARRLILPILDVLQSVPILGFFPVAVGFFIALFRGSGLGVEMAAVFLIFTSMFWNMAFGVYESLITIPEELRLVSDQLGLHGRMRWSRLYLPTVVPGLLYNSLVSWANGWYFLIASEIIAVGPARYTLPGLGSYLAQAVAEGRNEQTVLALLALLATTVGMHLLLWSPLATWAERFHFEESGDRPRVTAVARTLGRSHMIRWVTRHVAIPAGQQALALGGRILDMMGRHGRYIGVGMSLVVLPVATLFVWRVAQLFLARPISRELALIPGDLILSFFRVASGVALSVAVALPLTYWIGRRPSWRNPALAVIQILASLPATAFFPLIVVLVTWGMGMNVAAVLLALTTMFWYVLFNVLGAATALPKELREVSASLGLRRMLFIKRVFAPAVLPGLITGCLTAWGAGWNAMILCEYIDVEGRILKVRGIGATLDQATYNTGDMQIVAASLLAMVILIVLVNRLIWDPLYQRAARFKMEL